MSTSKLLTASIWPNNKSSKFMVTLSKEINTKPRAKKDEKIKNEIKDNQWDKFITSLEQSSKRFNLLKEGDLKDFENFIKTRKANIIY